MGGCLCARIFLRRKERKEMDKVKREKEFVECRQPNGVISMVPSYIFDRALYETRHEKDHLVMYVTYKEGAEMYRMSEKFFREWVNEIGAAKHLTQGKVIVSISKIEEYLKYL